MDLPRLLVVDDEPSLLRLLTRYLSRANYAVDACAGGEEAWQRFQDGEQAYAAAIVDLSLPDLPGEELVRRIRSRRPDFPIIVCSGALPDLDAMSGSGVRYVQKPFLPQMLLDTLSAALRPG